jgi:hypothetical protein
MDHVFIKELIGIDHLKEKTWLSVNKSRGYFEKQLLTQWRTLSFVKYQVIPILCNIFNDKIFCGQFLIIYTFQSNKLNENVRHRKVYESYDRTHNLLGVASWQHQMYKKS